MARCKGCDKRIVWGVDSKTGKPVPLDPVAPTYRVLKHDASGASVVELLPIGEDGERASMVSHFATCPKASQFSSKR